MYGDVDGWEVMVDGKSFVLLIIFYLLLIKNFLDCYWGDFFRLCLEVNFEFCCDRVEVMWVGVDVVVEVVVLMGFGENCYVVYDVVVYVDG